MSENCIMDEGAGSISEIFKGEGSCFITKLNLSNNEITGAGAKLLFGVLKNYQLITHLILDHNRIG